MIFIIPILWLAFVSYWIASSGWSKKNAYVSGDWVYRLFRMTRILPIIAVLQIWLLATDRQHANESNLVLGIIICVAGMSLAILSRRHLGKNWNFAPAIKEDQELITTGPYSIIRHPMYTGMLAAMFGAALVYGWLWLAAAVLFSITFTHKLKAEQKLMHTQFGEKYSAYMHRTKALIPFIW